jgi:hypothetical protein
MFAFMGHHQEMLSRQIWPYDRPPSSGAPTARKHTQARNLMTQGQDVRSAGELTPVIGRPEAWKPKPSRGAERFKCPLDQCAFPCCVGL